MSLQYFWSLFSSYPGKWLTAWPCSLPWPAAGCCWRPACASSAPTRLAGESELEEIDREASLLDEPTLRINRFFYLFGSSTLSAALLLSWFSTRL